MTIMLSMGLQVRFEEVMAFATAVRLVTLGILANYVLVPAATLALLNLFQANSMVSAGFLVLAVCPGAPVGPPITAIAKGNVAFAIGTMVILAGLSTILSPALLSILLPHVAPDINLRINYLAIVRTLLIAQMLPLAVGLGVGHWTPKLTQSIARPVAILANCLLVILIGLIVAAQHQTLAAIRPRGWTGMSLLLLASLGIGWFCGGPDLANRKTMAVTTVARNAAVGLVIATSSFAGTPAVTAVVAYGLFSIVGALGCALLFSRFSGNRTNNAQAG